MHGRLPKLVKQSRAIRRNRDSQPRPVLNQEEKAELRKLSAMLPTPVQRANPDQDPCATLHEASAYISALVATVVARVNNGTLPREVLAQLPVVPVVSERPRKKRAATKQH